MIGDEILDVVTIEGGWSSGGPGNHLAKRLRQRSPDLIIVFLEHVYPLIFYWGTSTEKKGLGQLATWRDDKDDKVGIDKADPLFAHRMEKIVNDGKGQFYVFESGHGLKKQFIKHQDRFDLEQMARDLGPNTYIANVYKDTEDPVEFIRKFGGYTGKDWHHPSAIGHQAYASAVTSIVQQAIQDGYPEHPRVEPWEARDICENWFDPGFPLQGINVHTEGLVKESFDPTKCVLEVRGDPNAEADEISGTMTVNNSSDAEQYLSIEFMVTGPITNNMVYPKTKILKWTKGEDEATAEESIVEPITDDF